MEPNLLHKTTQQLIPWRAGTPGRAPRNWRAVVLGRPLRLFVHLPIPAFIFSIAAPPLAHAQLFAPTQTVQIRVGGFITTPLVTDLVTLGTIDQSIPGVRSEKVTVKQRPGPIGTVAVRMPLRATTQLEVSASVARSSIRGDDGLETWDVMNATAGSVVFGLGYLYRGVLALRGGVGVIKLFAEERALFANGNAINPLLEGGVSSGIKLAGRPFEIDLRIQAHSFNTATLRDDGGTGGNVARAVLQFGTNIWQAGR